MSPDWDPVYRNTDYCLWLANRWWVLRIGQPAPAAITALQKKAGLRQRGSIITPCNPRSEKLDSAANRERLSQFRTRLQQDHIRWLPTTNRDPSGDWPQEPGALLIDCSPEYALTLAHEYGQNALVKIAPPDAPQLVYV